MTDQQPQKQDLSTVLDEQFAKGSRDGHHFLCINLPTVGKEAARAIPGVCEIALAHAWDLKAIYADPTGSTVLTFQNVKATASRIVRP